MNEEKIKKELLLKLNQYGFSNFEEKNQELTALMFSMKYQKEKMLNFTEEQWDYLIKYSDLKAGDYNGYSPIIYVFLYDKEQNLQLTKEQINYLIQNSDFKNQTENGYTILMLYYAFNKKHDIRFTEEQWNIIMEKINFKIESPIGHTLFHYPFFCDDFHEERTKIIFNGLEESQKQKMFLGYSKLKGDAKEYFINKYLESLKFALYDMKLEVHEETIAELQKNQMENQELLEMIKKRNIFFNLQNDLQNRKYMKNKKI